jgi:Alpha/beta hydrolase family
MEGGSTAGTVVLVHGGFVDGSGWQGVYSALRKDGYKVAIVQNPTLSLEGDVAATRRVIDAQGEPVILVGHSYGGAVITEAPAPDHNRLRRPRNSHTPTRRPCRFAAAPARMRSSSDAPHRLPLRTRRRRIGRPGRRLCKSREAAR